jgi:hypothetical protein
MENWFNDYFAVEMIFVVFQTHSHINFQEKLL